MLKIFVLLLLSLMLYAKGDSRVLEELSSKHTLIPLKEAMGEEDYKKAIQSGKYRYVGSSKCRLCHRKFFLGRKKDPHDYSMEALVKNNYDKTPQCLGCHSTGYGIPTGFVSMEKTPRLSNVQCEGCHGPGNIHIKRAKKEKNSFKEGGFLAGKDNPDVLHNMCITCHDERWNKSYHNLEKAYNKYKKADPNSRKNSQSCTQ